MDNDRRLDKKHVVERLRQELTQVAKARRDCAQSPPLDQARRQLRIFQSNRMLATHGDLLLQADTHDAAKFFLDDLYGAHDLTQRDADIERIVPMMERLLPLAALRTVAEAIAMDALSESLDLAMLGDLNMGWDEASYAQVYREVGLRDLRALQIDMVVDLGNSLCELVRIPLLGSTLAMMRRPAKMAGLEELHQFLERGFHAFKRMRNPKEFVATITSRERQIMANLFAGQPHPFNLSN